MFYPLNLGNQIPCGIDYPFKGMPYLINQEHQKRLVKFFTGDLFKLDPVEAGRLVNNIVVYSHHAPRPLFRVKKLILPQRCIHAYKGCLTFWIHLSHDGEGVKIQINKPDEEIDRGGEKKVKKGIEITLPNFIISDFVRLRPINKEKNWSPHVLAGFEVHRKLYDALNDHARNIRIAEPPSTRMNSENEPFSPEYIQTFYPSNLYKAAEHPLALAANYSAQELKNRLRLSFGLFCTIGAINNYGYFHRDVKPANILMDNQFNFFLSDFDLCGYNIYGMRYKYQYWDIATQKGLSNPYCDMVGAALCMLYALFPNSYNKLVSSDDSYHNFFKTKSPEEVFKLLMGDRSPHAKTLFPLVKLACEIIKAEDAIFSLILSSYIEHLTQKASRAKHVALPSAGVRVLTIERLSNKELSMYGGTSFVDFLEMNESELTFENVEYILCVFNQLTDPEKKYQENPADARLVSILRAFIANTTSNVVYQIKELICDWSAEKALVLDPEGLPFVKLELLNEDLFVNLSSSDPQERAKGFATIAQNAPTPSYAQEVIRKLL